MQWTVIEHRGEPMVGSSAILLSAPGGTIGRSPDNHLVLPDDQRLISRLQATVRVDETGRTLLRNMSSVLAIDLSGRTLKQGEEARVQAGDRVKIGSYVLQVDQDGTEGAPPSPLAQTPGPTMNDAPPTFAPSAPLSMLSEPLVDAVIPDTFSDLFGEGVRPIGAPRPASMDPAVTPPEGSVATPASTVPTRPPAPDSIPAPSPTNVPPPLASVRSFPTDWDTILANAPRRADGHAPGSSMPDPLAEEPFSLPTQAGRNPPDPLGELTQTACDDAIEATLRPSVDPLALFAEDLSAPSPLADQRPTALSETSAFEDAHPALSLLGPVAHVYAPSVADRTREIASQFRPPLPTSAPTSAADLSLHPAAEPSTLAPPTLQTSGTKFQEQAVDAATVASDLSTTSTAFSALPISPQGPSGHPVVSVLDLPSVGGAGETNVISVANSTPAAESASTHAHPTPPSVPDHLFATFLEAAGVPDVAGQQPGGNEAMRRVGRLMRAFTDGTMELLSSRALLKREVRAEITMIVDEENNPFKILPNGRAVLMQMFGARMPGFLSPEAAVSDALADLQSHQLGMVAGMRAALLMVLQRFDPAALDKHTPHDGTLGEKLLPKGRDARLWRELRRLHTETTAAVEDDFQAVFGRAFQQAYDKEMERLREARRA